MSAFWFFSGLFVVGFLVVALVVIFTFVVGFLVVVVGRLVVFFVGFLVKGRLVTVTARTVGCGNFTTVSGAADL